jgi:4,5-dihydroxyphthalate decarboxylase
MAVPLSIALGDYDVNDGLILGTVRVPGVELTPLVMPSPERHWRMVRHLEFDVCELSLATYLALRDRGGFPATAIPAFPHRRLRHGYAFVNAAAGIGRPADLAGRRVGVRNWGTTAGLWLRGILTDEHGLDLASIDWVAQDDDLPLDIAPYRLRRVPAGASVVEMLLAGELDGLIYPEAPPPEVLADPRMARLFPDPRAAEIAYLERGGPFPIMHTVVVRDVLVDAHPWLARALLDAFTASTELAFRRMRDPRRVSLAWFAEAMAEQRRHLGDAPCWSRAPWLAATGSS